MLYIAGFNIHVIICILNIRYNLNFFEKVKKGDKYSDIGNDITIIKMLKDCLPFYNNLNFQNDQYENCYLKIIVYLFKNIFLIFFL